MHQENINMYPDRENLQRNLQRAVAEVDALTAAIEALERVAGCSDDQH